MLHMTFMDSGRICIVNYDSDVTNECEKANKQELMVHKQKDGRKGFSGAINKRAGKGDVIAFFVGNESKSVFDEILVTVAI